MYAILISLNRKSVEWKTRPGSTAKLCTTRGWRLLATGHQCSQEVAKEEPIVKLWYY